MDPNVFITIVFAGIATLAAIGGAIFVVRMRPVARKPDRGSDKGSDAAVH